MKMVAGLAPTSKLFLWALKCVEDGQSPEGNETFLSVVMLASSKPSEELYARNSARESNRLLEDHLGDSLRLCALHQASFCSHP